jgi:hypothetical protein
MREFKNNCEHSNFNEICLKNKWRLKKLFDWTIEGLNFLKFFWLAQFFNENEDKKQQKFFEICFIVLWKVIKNKNK